jgi:hypothetical protein
METEYAPWLKTAYAVQQWLPPGLAARALEQAGNRQPVGALASLGVLGLWALAAGSVLARASAGRVSRRKPGFGAKTGNEPGKDFLSASLSCPARGRLAAGRLQPHCRADGKGGAQFNAHLAAALGDRRAPIDGAGAGQHLRSNASGHPFLYALPLYVAFALMGFTQMFSNNLGAEGAGFSCCFSLPRPSAPSSWPRISFISCSSGWMRCWSAF